MAHAKAAHHRGLHDKLSRICRRAWNADPTTTCSYCGLTRDQGVELWGEQGEWQAAHKVARRIARTTNDYMAAHAHCNQGDNARRNSPTSRNW